VRWSVDGAVRAENCSQAGTATQREQFLLAYQQTIQGAFCDVSNALVAYRKNREFTVQQEQLLKSALLVNFGMRKRAAFAVSIAVSR
jgi:hypothetical protein